MKIAIMQPYFFPYVGYFELINSVDKFVFLTDVQFKKRCWITRNKIRSKNKEFHYLTIPTKKTNFECNINNIFIDNNDWVEKYSKTFIYTYGQKVKSHKLFNYFCELKKHKLLHELLCDSIKWISKYLNIDCEFYYSDNISKKSKENKIIEICKHFNCDTYINLSGGMSLYDIDYFNQNGIDLQFLPFTKFTNTYSIIDAIFYEEENIKNWIQNENYNIWK